MTALHSGPDAPAQFVFDHGRLGGTPGLFAAVSSGARSWAERGAAAVAEVLNRQLTNSFPAGTWVSPLTAVRTLIERRATFVCAPALRRPATAVAPGLTAAGDYIDGPYPATLEGAVRSGLAAVNIGIQIAVSPCKNNANHRTIAS
jgi:hypothetical protein